MAVKTYAYTDTTAITAHFKASEFRCRCGKSHDFLVSTELVEKLEILRETLNCSKIVINSGYRCADHDKAVGGTGSGQHTKGMAADIICYDSDGTIISSKTICCTAQDLGFTGVANITAAYTSTHLDVRTGAVWYGDETTGTNTVTSDFYAYFGIAKTLNTETSAETAASSGVTAKGIDVSKHQGTIDWDKVFASGKVEFAMLRAGYGKETSQIDSQFEENYEACTRLGIPCGAYWYSYAATAAEARQEAAVCLSALAGKVFDYPIAYDIEETKSLAAADALAEAFCGALENAGYYAMVYSYQSALESTFSSKTKAAYDTWLAHVDVTQPGYVGDYGLWQYSWNGSIPGISGDVDLDYAYRDYPAIIRNAGLNGTARTEVRSGDTEQTTDTLEQILAHVASIDEKIQ